MIRRARSLFDFILAALCLWAAWYHTPPGALLRAAAARMFHARTTARPLLAYYGAGARSPRPQPEPPPSRGPLAPAAALGMGAWAAYQQMPEPERALLLSRSGLRAATPESLAAWLAGAGSPDAAVLTLFCGEEPARFALERAGSDADLEDLARELPPRYADRVELAAHALALGTAYALGWPLPDSVRVSSPFGLREHPMLGSRRMHSGVDLGVPVGTAVRAAGPGVVRRASSDAANGRLLLIDHGSGVSTLYCHNDALLVSEGDQVESGQVIARSGDSGRSTGPHLHYQLDLPGGPVDPLRFRTARAPQIALGPSD